MTDESTVAKTEFIKPNTVLKIQSIIPISILVFILIITLSLRNAASGTDAGDFEWMPPSSVMETGHNQYLEKTVRDPATGEVYVVFNNKEPGEPDTSSNWPPNATILSPYDPSSMSFNAWTTRDYVDPDADLRLPHLWDYVVYNRTWYYVFVRNDTIHLRTQDIQGDVLRLNVSDIDTYGRGSDVQVLGVFDGHLKIALKVQYPGPLTVHIVSIDVLTFDHQSEKIFTADEESYIFNPFKVSDGLLYWAMETVDASPPPPSVPRTYSLVTYDLTLGTTSGPLAFHEDWYDYVVKDYVMDASGNIRVLALDNERSRYYLMNVSPLGEVVDETVVDACQVNAPGYPSLLINGTDRLYLVQVEQVNNTYEDVLAIYLLPVGPSSDILSNYIPLRPYQHRVSPILTGDDRLLVAWQEAVSGLYSIRYTVQTPLAPDLTFVEGTFRIAEDPAWEEPIAISVKVRNQGRAPCEGFTIELLRIPAQSQEPEVLRLLVAEGTLELDGTYDVELRVALPRGDNLLQLVIRDVEPFENVRTNNVLEVRVYASVNNPPRLTVSSPSNGTVWDGLIDLRGTAWDLDEGQEIAVHVRGIPAPVIQGTGEWDATVDISGMASGDYLLAFQAFDGIGWSGVEYRSVRVDHIVDGLILEGTDPDSDVELRLGTSEAFHILVRERFSRPLAYTWTVSGEPHGANASSFVLRAEEVGSFVVEVSVTNGLTTLVHRWNVSVRSPIRPSISRISPVDEEIIVLKHETIGFVVEILNPDNLTCSSTWSIDNASLDGVDPYSRTARFDVSGTYRVTMSLFTEASAQSTVWYVSVLNRPPRINSSIPDESNITIADDVRLEFLVEPFDPDGDVLSYTWTFTGLVAASQNASSMSVDIPYGADSTCIVRVEASDGEGTASHEWVVWSKPTGPRPNTVGGVSIVTWLAILLLLIMVMAIYALYRKKGLKNTQ